MGRSAVLPTAAHLNIVNTDASLVHQTYVVSFYGDQILTTVTADAGTVTRWIEELERPSFFTAGLGMHFHDSASSIATLEFCLGSRCLIYQLSFVENRNHPEALLNLLHDDECTFTGLTLWSDLVRLDLEHYIGIKDWNVVDLTGLMALRHYGRRVSGYGEFHSAGLKELAAAVLHKELVDPPESVMLTNWHLRRLTSEQVKHACAEAFVSFEIGRVLDARDHRKIRPGKLLNQS